MTLVCAFLGLCGKMKKEVIIVRKKPFPIGIEFYKKMIDKPYYYVDKTLMIKNLLDKGGEVNLFTRPRRFGKTLTLTMLKTFFECEVDRDGNAVDNSRYFREMKIWQEGEEYRKEQGQYPVIFLSLKSAKQPNYGMAYHVLRDAVISEFERHSYVLEGLKLSDSQKEKYKLLTSRKGEEGDYVTSLQFLSKCLAAWHGRNVIILLDEYDVPLENAHFQGFYPEMADFLRSFFESAMKTNDNLEFAVVTGCLRISRESIFTGLNNLKAVSVLTRDYAEYFGFIEEEVQEMLKAYGIEQKMEEARRWYDGYRFGDTEVYNPWSIVNYVETAVSDVNAFPRPYWSNTSSNSIIRELIEAADPVVKQDVERLADGGTIEVEVHEDITYDDIYGSQDNLWNFLFFTGYLKKVSERLEGQNIYLGMAIPNQEVLYVYRRTVMEWFEGQVKQKDFSRLYRALAEKDCPVIEQEINAQLIETISFYDYAESYYHGFLAGLLRENKECAVRSNRESGNGRPDLVVYTLSVRGMAIIIEIKAAKKFEEMEAGCDATLAQIEEQNYQEEWRRIGYRNIIKYGICFYRKECMVRVQA